MVSNQKQQPVRVRFAPSPTGWLHLGTARTALLNYLFAKKNKGKFILRLEDTDIKRCRPEYEKDILEALLWLGLRWDEGPYRQSERSHLYKKYIQKLLNSGQAFWCYHSPAELKKEKEAQMASGKAPRHICSQKSEVRSEKLENKGVIRFKTPSEKVTFNDLIRGKIEFDTSLLGDFAIAKDTKTPLYNLAVVIDDVEMKISHIIRGEDHISNTPKQILLYRALGLKIPQYAHLPLILGPDKSKLSKRHGPMAISEYKAQGYLPQALINFMAFLGWNPGDEREIFSLAELEKEFSLKRVGESAAIFNPQRLNYLNGYYIRQMPVGELAKLCVPYLEKAKLIKKMPNDKFQKIIFLEQERLKRLSEIGESTRFFFEDKLKYKKELLAWKDMPAGAILVALDKLAKILSETKQKDWSAPKLQKILLPEAEKFDDRGKLLWPLRVALTGQKASPPPFEIMEILGKKKTMKRLREARKMVESANQIFNYQ